MIPGNWNKPLKEIGVFRFTQTQRDTQSTGVSSTLRMNEIACMNEWMNE
jgi:hypothetical protein